MYMFSIGHYHKTVSEMLMPVTPKSIEGPKKHTPTMQFEDIFKSQYRKFIVKLMESAMQHLQYPLAVPFVPSSASSACNLTTAPKLSPLSP